MTTVHPATAIGDLVAPAQYGDGLRVVLVGPGAETRGNATYETLRKAVEQRGAWCQSFDFARAGELSPMQSALEQWDWLMRNYQPQFVLAPNSLPNGLPDGVAMPKGCQVISQLDDLPTTSTRVIADGPKVSLFVPYYNTAEFLDEQMKATLDQTYDDFEMVYLDDGCVDDSRSVLAKYESDPRLRIVRQENIGQSRRFDLLFSQVDPMLRGEYVAFLGADDVSEPTRFERQIEAFERHPKAEVVHSAATLIDGLGNTIGNYFKLSYSYNQYTLFSILLRSNVVGNPSVMMRTSALREVGGWRGGLACDYELWLELARRQKPFLYLPEKLVRYRDHGGNVSRSSEGFLDEHLDTLSRSLVADFIVQSSLEDLYPGLSSKEAMAVDFAAANMDSGLIAWRVQNDRDLAESRFDAAMRLAPELESVLAWDLAILAKVANDYAKAEHWRERALRLGSREARQGLPLEAEHFVFPESLSTKLFRAPEELEDSVLGWDGNTSQHARILVNLDWSNGMLLFAILRRWVDATSMSDSVDLVFATFGTPVPRCLEAFTQAAASLDLESAAPVILEDWKEHWALPTNHFLAQVWGTSTVSVLHQLDEAIRTYRAAPSQ